MIMCRKKKGKLNLRAFSGIHVVSPEIFDSMIEEDKEVFSIIDVYLAAAPHQKIKAFPHDENLWLDVGKPESLEHGKEMLGKIELG